MDSTQEQELQEQLLKLQAEVDRLTAENAALKSERSRLATMIYKVSEQASWVNAQLVEYINLIQGTAKR